MGDIGHCQKTNIPDRASVRLQQASESHGPFVASSIRGYVKGLELASHAVAKGGDPGWAEGISGDGQGNLRGWVTKSVESSPVMGRV